MSMLVTFSFALALVPLISVIWQVVIRGLARFDLTFFTSLDAWRGRRRWRRLHALLGTLIITTATAIMHPHRDLDGDLPRRIRQRGALAKWITMLVDVMTGIPSIVAGLFAYSLFLLFFGPGVRMGIGAAVALSLLMVPIVVRTTEEMLKLVPRDLREASYALGAPKWKTV